MSIENIAERLIAALEANTAALLGASPMGDMPAPTVAAAVETEAPTKDDVMGAVTKLLKLEGKETVTGLLASFGVKKVSELDTAKYAVFLEKAQEVLP